MLALIRAYGWSRPLFGCMPQTKRIVVATAARPRADLAAVLRRP